MSQPRHLPLSCLLALAACAGSAQAAEPGKAVAFKDLPPAVQKAFSASLHGDTSKITTVEKLEPTKRVKVAVYDVRIPQNPGMELHISVNEQGQVMQRDLVKAGTAANAK